VKTIALKFVCLAVLAGMAASGQQDHEAEVGSKVLALEHAWNQAESLKDLTALDSLFDNGVAYVDFDGTLVTKAEYLLRVKSRPFPQGITESITARVFPNVVIVTGVYVSREVKKGKPLLRRGRFVDAWVRRGESWVCVAAEATPILD
jgi:hypothetical protein